jgi:DNA-directed RNA polymerase specialized sigma24 family protein
MNSGLHDIAICWMNSSGRKSVTVLKQVFAISYRPLYYFASELVRNREKAEEIVADSFLAVWQLEEDPGDFQNLKSLLYLFTRNACYQYLKRAGRLSPEQAAQLYSLNNWEEDLQHQMIESELLYSIVHDR